MENDVSKALPFVVKKGYTAIPNAVGQLYIRHPWFTPAAERLYRYLLSCYNASYGYAWPSWDAMIAGTGLGRGTIAKSLDTLEHLELIERKFHTPVADVRAFKNRKYTFLAPIEDEQAFEQKFGAVIERIKKERFASLAAMKEADLKAAENGKSSESVLD